MHQCKVLTLPLHVAYVCTDICVRSESRQAKAEKCARAEIAFKAQIEKCLNSLILLNQKAQLFPYNHLLLLLFQILQVAKDDRSDIESSSDEEETVPRSKTLHSTITTNGTSGANGTNGYLTGGTCSEEH